LASVKEVARHAGVSVGTVSNVLNRPDVVAPETRQRVLDAIEALGFVRNESARHLRTGRSNTIGLVVLDVANPFFTDVATGADSMVDEMGGTLILCHSAEDPAREARHLAMLEEQRVQGVLITPVDSNNPHIDRLMAHGIPVVLVDRAGRRHQCSVAVDDELGGRLAVDHLLERGHRNIAFVGGPFSIQQVTDRHRGAEAAVADIDDDARIEIIEMRSLKVSDGQAAGQRLFDLPPGRRPTAVFCANDLLALGILQEAVQHSLRVPDDIAIVGYDDIGFAAAAAVPLSSVRQPREQLGRTAAQLLADEVNDPEHHTHRQVVYQPELIIRASSAAWRNDGGTPTGHQRGDPIRRAGDHDNRPTRR
jgi:LacI family transcriptional regulator